MSLNGEEKPEQLCHHEFFMRFEIGGLCNKLIESAAWLCVCENTDRK